MKRTSLLFLAAAAIAATASVPAFAADSVPAHSVSTATTGHHHRHHRRHHHAKHIAKPVAAPASK